MIRKQIFETRIEGKDTNIQGCDIRLIESVHRTRSNEFLVITDLGLSPFINNSRVLEAKVPYKGYLNLIINTTEYFYCPIYGKRGMPGHGVSNLIIPLHEIPEKRKPEQCKQNKKNKKPPRIYKFSEWNWGIYVLPGQNIGLSFWMKHRDGTTDASTLLPSEYIDVAMGYIKCTGIEAAIADNLLEIGIPVTKTNILWGKRLSTDRDGDAWRRMKRRVELGQEDPPDMSG